MKKLIRYCSIIILFSTVFPLNYNLFKNYSTPFLPIERTKLVLEKYFILDSVGIIFGLRKIISDIAWIQLLQYYGSEPYEIDEEESPKDEEHSHYEHMTKIQKGKYKRLLDYFKRVVLLDPLHTLAYFYGIGALAWNVERPQEALELANIGLENLKFQKGDPNSDYWEIFKYQQAIYYKLSGNYGDMLNKLKEIVESGKSPNLVKAILANLYKKYGYYKEALKIWEEILSSGDPEYTERAKIQIYLLKSRCVDG